MQALADAGPATATSLACAFPISRQAVAKHLSALEEAGLVRGVRAGREVQFELTPAPLADAATWMAEVGADWDQRLSSLRRYLTRR